MWLVRHAFAIAVLPVTAALLVPLWVARRYEVSPAIPAHAGEWLLVVLGVALFAAGAALFVSTVYLFATEGRGTLAPWDPPSRLVVRGPYRYVRNPMISGVLFIITAEALVLRSWPHAIWAASFFVINAIYIPAFEEIQLEDRFGDDYRVYKKNVGRFLPRGDAVHWRRINSTARVMTSMTSPVSSFVSIEILLGQTPIRLHRATSRCAVL